MQRFCCKIQWSASAPLNFARQAASWIDAVVFELLIRIRLLGCTKAG